MPRRIRDYAKERAQRDAKYLRLEGKTYNQHESQRRKDVAKAEGYINFKQRQKVKKFTRKLAQQLADRHFTEEMLELGDSNDPLYWAAFQAWYNRRFLPA